MSSTDLRRRASEKLRFLVQTVGAEADLLAPTDGRLFALPMDAQRAGTLREDVDFGERVDAFVARFGRLFTETKIHRLAFRWTLVQRVLGSYQNLYFSATV